MHIVPDIIGATNPKSVKSCDEFIIYLFYSLIIPVGFEVPFTDAIPSDYDGVMGVPITFLDKYNPEQFEIIGQMVTTKVDDINHGYPYIDGKKIFARILIKKRAK